MMISMLDDAGIEYAQTVEVMPAKFTPESALTFVA